MGIVVRWLIWLVGEEMKFGMEFGRDELSLELGPNTLYNTGVSWYKMAPDKVLFLWLYK